MWDKVEESGTRHVEKRLAAEAGGCRGWVNYRWKTYHAGI